jgi:hypothetical protein
MAKGEDRVSEWFLTVFACGLIAVGIFMLYMLCCRIFRVDPHGDDPI